MNWTALPRSGECAGIAFHRQGAGPPLVLLHGVGLRAESWCAQLPALSPGHTVYALDMPGHGHSPGLQADAPSLADFTERVRHFVDTAIGEPVGVAGHSMGAMIALDLAIRHPGRCVAVAALNAVFHRSDEARRAVRERAASLAASASEDLSAAPVARWFGPSPSTQTAAAAGACRAWLAGADREGYACAYRVFAAEDGPADEALARLPIPALFVTGAMDLNSTPAMARRMASMAPRGRASIIEDAGHMAQMTHAHEINRTLAAFFQPRSC